MKPCPCNHCTERYRACQDTCSKDEYLAYREEQKKASRNRAKEADIRGAHVYLVYRMQTVRSKFPHENEKGR